MTRKQQQKILKFLIVFLSVILILILCFSLATFIIKTAGDMFGLNQVDKDIDVNIRKGMSVSDAIELMNAKGVIDEPAAFKLYLKFRKSDINIKAGEYVLNSNMSYDQIIAALHTGNAVANEVRITFYEGMTEMEIADMLEENKVCDATEFMEYLQSAEFEYDFVDLIPENELRYRKFEGYLFPDTYDFFEDENVASVAKKFIRNFNKKVYEPLYDEIKEAGFTLDEAIALASIVQAEASEVEEMELVSSVFNNRINNPSAGLPMLQSDVTIHYIESDIRPFQSKQTQEIYDAYNTYVCRGIPVGPICNPGVDAIEATIHPKDTNYYFFVTDVNGKYYYSKTIDEHDINVYKASKVKKAK